MGSNSELELKEFANALQLSIERKIADVSQSGGKIAIKMDSKVSIEKDERLLSFLRIFKSHFDPGTNSFVIEEADGMNLPKMTLFLLLTRLDKDNIAKLVELDNSTAEIAEKMGVVLGGNSVDSVAKCSQLIFDRMKREGITIRELAETSGLTNVTISNFKAGKDIRLSNLLKVAKALRMNLRIK